MFFPELGLFYGSLWLIKYVLDIDNSDAKLIDKHINEIRESNFVTQIDNALFIEIRRQMNAHRVVNMTWWEEARAYLETPPSAFNKYRYYFGNASVVPIYPDYLLEVMVLAYNHWLVEDELILVNGKNEDGSGEAKLAFNGRQEKFSIPKSLPDMDKVMRVVANVLQPDYELRYCRLASRHRVLQNLMCLRPEEWSKLTDTYGKRKMRRYFSPITNRFRSMAFVDIPWEARFFNVLARYESPL